MFLRWRSFDRCQRGSLLVVEVLDGCIILGQETALWLGGNLLPRWRLVCLYSLAGRYLLPFKHIWSLRGALSYPTHWHRINREHVRDRTYCWPYFVGGCLWWLKDHALEGLAGTSLWLRVQELLVHIKILLLFYIMMMNLTLKRKKTPIFECGPFSAAACSLTMSFHC